MKSLSLFVGSLFIAAAAFAQAFESPACGGCAFVTALASGLNATGTVALP